MKKIFIGIDVSKKTIDASVIIPSMTGDKPSLQVYGKFDNRPSGFRKMVAMVRKAAAGIDTSEWTFCCETTGGYDIALCDYITSKQMIIWPGALVSYRNDKEIAVDLLEDQIGQSSEEALNASMQHLEFRLLDAIKKVTRFMKPNIAFIEGHGELSEADVYDITQSLSQNYNVGRVEIDGKVDALMQSPSLPSLLMRRTSSSSTNTSCMAARCCG